MTYRFPAPVKEAIFLERPNRFIVIVSFAKDKLICHLPNPGRMTELLFPGVNVLITFNSNPKRKTKATVVGVRVENEIIQLQSNLVAKWLPVEFAANQIPGLQNYRIIKQEYSLGSHRFDYLLSNPDNMEVITEVKSTTRVHNSVACFPDGVSKRASDHLVALIELAKAGSLTMLIFVVQRFSLSFWPCEDVDPLFTSIFKTALKQQNLDIRILLSETILVKEDNEYFIELDFKGILPLNK